MSHFDKATTANEGQQRDWNSFEEEKQYVSIFSIPSVQ